MTRALLRQTLPMGTLLLALGCAEGGQTGEETTLACEETRTVLGAGDDSPLGFGAEEVLAVASAENAALEWLVTDPPYGPEHGTAELTVSIEALASAAFVESRNPDGREAYPCEDHVELGVAVTLATSGGALAESFEAKLRSTDATTALLAHVFPHGDVDGTLSFDEAGLGTREIERVTFDARFDAGAVSGTLSAGIEHVSGDTVGFQDLTIACFGASTERCP